MNPQPLQYLEDELYFVNQTRPLSEIVKDYKRPVYVYDLAWMKKRAADFKRSLPSARIHYAMKANHNPGVLKLFKSLGLHIDVVSAGEIEKALENGFSPSDIIFSGVGKTKDEISYALKLGIYQINAESLPELQRLSDRGTELKIQVPVSLRLNPNIDIGTHPYIATGLKENKFGLGLDQIDEAVALIKKSKALKPVGVSFHLGSQMTDPSSLRQAFQDIKKIYKNLRSEWSTVTRFDFGGGLGIFYQSSQEQENELLEKYSEIIRQESKDFDAELQCEPGRWLVAHGGVYIAQVQYVKKTKHKTFVILDGGMNHLLRPALYGAHHEIFPLKQFFDRPEETYDIVGPICESSDFLAKDRKLRELREGDLIAIADAGAYGAVMASTYNLHALPMEICLT